MLKTLNMALIRCPAGVSDEIIAVFQIEKSQIDTENDKEPQNLHFLKFLRIFHRIFESLREFEKFKGPTRKRLVVQ